MERHGFDDPRLRLSVNFIGAPALKGKAYQAYRAAHPVNTVVGAALAVRLPLGEYKKDKLLNLGENRFVFRPQLGFVLTTAVVCGIYLVHGLKWVLGRARPLLVHASVQSGRSDQRLHAQEPHRAVRRPR